MLIYADNTALLVQSSTTAATCLSSFSEAASTLGLCISWRKTKLQNFGADTQPTTDITVDGSRVECGKLCVSGQCTVFRWSVPIGCQETHCPCFIGDGLLKEDMAWPALITTHQNPNIQSTCSLHSAVRCRDMDPARRICPDDGSWRAFTWNANVRYSASDGRIMSETLK